jgi:hypothetical protein
LCWEISNWSILEHSVFGVSPKLLKRWSGRRGSNPRRPAWEAGILPLNYSRFFIYKCVKGLDGYRIPCATSMQHKTETRTSQKVECNKLAAIPIGRVFVSCSAIYSVLLLFARAYMSKPGSFAGRPEAQMLVKKILGCLLDGRRYRPWLVRLSTSAQPFESMV